MRALDEQIAQLQSAIAVQEALRPTIGDALVEVTLAALRAQIDGLRAQQEASQPSRADILPEQLLARLQSYIPRELAEKISATGRIESERKQVTVLFADISGFTSLSERLDPEEVAALTNGVLKELADVVYQHEGYIDKFVGDSIMALFGAPVAHEDDPERALRTALAMRERLAHFNRRWADRLDQPLALHIGINTGLVVACDVGSDLRLSYTVMGDTVNTASRLQDVALPGQILVSRDTYRLTQTAFTFLTLEPITVKGKREPLPVFELQRVKLYPSKLRGLTGLASVFVGRDDDLTRLREVMHTLDAGRGCIVTITGEAGIGKSRLMAEWRTELDGRVLWLEGRAFAYTSSLAYGPFLDLFRHYIGIQDDDSEAQARARLQAMVEHFFPGNAEAHAIFANLLAMRLLPNEAALLASFPAEALRQRLFALIKDLLVQLVHERPVWLIIEDMHWADLTSVELVEHLLPLTEHVPLAIVGVFRSRSHELLDKLQAVIETHYDDRFIQIALEPLSKSSSLEMVERLLVTRDLPASLTAMIQSKAEGNPFFVEEILRDLIERGALVRAETGKGWRTTPLLKSVAVPDTLQGLLMARLDRLPGETKWVAQQASVIGRIFLYRVLLHMAKNMVEIDADLQHLEQEQLIRERARHPEIEYMFKHALTQEVAYQSLLAPRRKELHRKVGQAMEVIFAERLSEFHSILAEHFLRGETWDKAADYFILAGDAADRLYAHAEARQHYAKALDALSYLPDIDNNRRRRVDTIIKRVSVSLAGTSPEQNLAWLVEAEALAKTLLSPDGTPGGDRLRLAHVHFWMGRAHHYRNELPEAIGYFQQVLAEAHELDDADLAAIPASLIGRMMGLQGQFGKAEILLSQAIAPLEKTANWTEWVFAVGYLGLSLAARGDYAAGVAQGQRALARALEMNYLTGVAASHILLFFIYVMGADLPRMLEESRASVEAAKQSGDQVYIYVGLGFRAWAESQLGLHEEASQSMKQSEVIRQSLGGRLIMAPVLAAIKADIALNAGRVEEALTLAEAAVAMAQEARNVFGEALAHRVWGQALAALHPPPWHEADEHLVTSLHVFESGASYLEAARTQVSWGLLCRARNDASAACEHLEQAAARFEAASLTAELEHTRKYIVEIKERSERLL